MADAPRRPIIGSTPATPGPSVHAPGPDPIRSGAAMGTVTLHPNLARLAATYQRICERFLRGELDAVGAAVEIRELVARDDEGTQWTINPKDGGWLFMNRWLVWTPGVPPAYGLATLTPHDLTVRDVATGREIYNADGDITFRAVDERALPDNTMRGATRRAPSAQGPWVRPRWLYPLLVGIILAVAGFVYLSGRDDSGGPVAPGPTVQVPPDDGVGG